MLQCSFITCASSPQPQLFQIDTVSLDIAVLATSLLQVPRMLSIYPTLPFNIINATTGVSANTWNHGLAGHHLLGASNSWAPRKCQIDWWTRKVRRSSLNFSIWICLEVWISFLERHVSQRRQPFSVDMTRDPVSPTE